MKKPFDRERLFYVLRCIMMQRKTLRYNTLHFLIRILVCIFALSIVGQLFNIIMRNYTIPLYENTKISTKSVGNETAKVLRAMRKFTKEFVEYFGRGYPFKSSLCIGFDPDAKEFYFGTDAWTVILSTDTASDDHMMLTTENHLCISCDDELGLIWAIKSHRHKFVDAVNKV